MYLEYGFAVNANTRLREELTILILKNCKARVRISFRSTPPTDYGSLLKSVYAAINADTKVPALGRASNKSKVNISLKGDESNCNSRSALLVEMQGADISALRAALNSYLWLVEASINAYNASVTTSS